MQRASRLIVAVLAVGGSLSVALVLGGDSSPGTTSASSARPVPPGIRFVATAPVSSGVTGSAGRACLGHDGLDSGIFAQAGRGARDPGIVVRLGRADLDHAIAIPRCGAPSASDR